MYPTPEERVFIEQHAGEDVLKLALKLSGRKELDAGRVIRQIKGIQVVAGKVPSWSPVSGELLFPHLLSLEQCSSETTARYKADLISSLSFLVSHVADLTGGLGVDSWFFSRAVLRADYVEQQPALCEAARHNFSVLGGTNLGVHEADSVDYLSGMSPVDLLYLDPARRTAGGGKVVGFSDCAPDVTVLREKLLEKARFVLIKASPMLDISMALKQLPETRSVHVVSVDNECKELLFLLSSFDTADVELVCINLKTNGSPERDAVLFKGIPSFQKGCHSFIKDGIPLAFLYEPNASLMKAGAFDYVSSRYHVAKLHPNSHLFTSSERVPDFPGRTFQVIDTIPYQRKHLKKRWPDLTKANITARNFPDTVATIRKNLTISEGGDDYVFATTLINEANVLIRTKKAT